MRETVDSSRRETQRTNIEPLRLVLLHLHDWIIVCALFALDRVLAMLHPFYRFVGKFTVDDFRLPQRPNTIPFSAVPVLTIVLPMLFFVAIYYRKRDIRDLHHATLGLLYSVMLSATVTDAVKDYLGLPRPDFFWRCFPDGRTLFNNITGEVICHGDPSGVKEGHKSFPSGHTAWSFSGLGFLSLYLAGKVRIFDKRGHIAKLIIVLSPLALATFIGFSRLNDYKHHWQDILAATFLASTIAILCYRQFFPAPYHDNCMNPYVVMPISEESSPPGGSSLAAANENGHQLRPQSDFSTTDVETGRRANDASDERMGL